MRTRNKILAWTMMLVLFTHSIGVDFMYSIYHLDQKLFVELFCINQDKPEMHCDGSCMLSELDGHKTHDHEKPATPDIGHYQLTFVLEDFDFKSETLDPADKVLSLSQYKNSYSFQYLKDVFHPPVLV